MADETTITVTQDKEEGKDEINDIVENETNHENVIFSGTLPGPDGSVPSSFINVTPLKQRTDAEDLFNFLNTEDRHLLELNGDDTPRVALISIPETKMVRVVYSVGMGSSGIGRANALSNKILMLTGDGDIDIGPPTPLTLPASVVNFNEVLTMTQEQFCEKLTTKGATYTYPLLAGNKVRDTKIIMQIAPIPPYLVLDGFNKDLDAAEVYERLLSIADHELDSLDHAKLFLLSCLTSHKVGDNKPYVSSATFMSPTLPPARNWASKRFKHHFPTLTATPATNAITPTSGVDPNIAALLASLLPSSTAALMTNTRSADGEEKKDDDTLTGISKQELQATLAMCGEDSSGSIEDLPPWFSSIMERGMNDQFKLTIIRKHIMDNVYYDDAEVPLSTPLLKMALKRNWVGKDGNIRRPSLIHAADGISPFLCLELDEDSVAQINEDEDTLQRASHVTFQDLKNFKKKITPSIPEQAADYMLLLKRYANLLFALFSSGCPHFQCVLLIINALKTFSKSAKDNMTTRTKASILWIVLLQARQFAIGDMSILAEFTTMHTNLSAKMGMITHAEVPNDLYQAPIIKRKEQIPYPDIKPPPPKRQRIVQSGWHPTLKAQLSGPMQKARNPALHAIMRYCGKSVEELYPKFGNRCTPHAVLGRCWAGDKCTRDHAMATDNEAKEILALLTKFTENPAGIMQG